MDTRTHGHRDRDMGMWGDADTGTGVTRTRGHGDGDTQAWGCTDAGMHRRGDADMGVHIPTSARVLTRSMHIRVHAYKHERVHTRTCSQTCAHAHMGAHTDAFVSVYTHPSSPAERCTHLCSVCHRHTRTHTELTLPCAHTRTHTCPPSFSAPALWAVLALIQTTRQAGNTPKPTASW